MNAALEFLRLLSARVPPEPGRYHHLVMIVREGHAPALALAIPLGRGVHTFLLEQEDLTKPVAQIVDELARLIDKVRACMHSASGHA